MTAVLVCVYNKSLKSETLAVRTLFTVLKRSGYFTEVIKIANVDARDVQFHQASLQNSLPWA